MFTKAYPLLSWLLKTHWQVEEVTPEIRGDDSMYHGTQWPTGGVNLTYACLLADCSNFKCHYVRLEADGSNLECDGAWRGADGGDLKHHG